MVEKFKKILANIEKSRGAVTLFALVRMDELVDKWAVILCASWATSANRSEVFEEVRHEIVTNLDSKEISEIARIGIFDQNSHLVQDLLRYKSGTELRDTRVNGNQVHHAHIIVSSPSDLSSQSPSRIDPAA